MVGDGWLVEPDLRLELARACGRGLVDAGCRIVTGGLGGVMRAACEGARSSGAYTMGCIIGLLPGHDPAEANEHVDVPIANGLDIARNLVANADALVAIGGGAGTLSEIAVAWQLRRLIVALRAPGWSGELADRRVDERAATLTSPRTGSSAPVQPRRRWRSSCGGYLLPPHLPRHRAAAGRLRRRRRSEPARPRRDVHGRFSTASEGSSSPCGGQ